VEKKMLRKLAPLISKNEGAIAVDQRRNDDIQKISDQTELQEDDETQKVEIIKEQREKEANLNPYCQPILVKQDGWIVPLQEEPTEEGNQKKKAEDQTP
jgi:hypothetical protein